ncbi:MAG: two-component sensor histidine kinase [Deltaproteobacteria bacterium HGW-Deltaproteobacteria-4]|nr:MAG: two-component sensor histidine kinase [Deltaproteobacteria bacterium HGW-Deltaproteobacteria-4]
MKLGLTSRLFLVLLTASALVACGMFFIMHWNIDRGFLRYVNTLDQERLELLAAEVERSYATAGSWDFIRDEPKSLLRLMVNTLPEGQIRPKHLDRLERRLERRRERPEPPPPGMAHLFELRVQLLDSAGRHLAGPPQPLPAEGMIPLHYQGQKIGTLGLLPQKNLADAHQLRFLKEQKLGLAQVAGLTLLVAALFSLPLARRLVRPLREIAAATRRLATGTSTERIAVTSQDELGQLASDFNLLALTLQQNETARRQWIADISHELRTPLTVLRGEIEALQDGVRPLTPAALSSLHGEALRLGRLVDDLYQLSLSDLGALQYRKELLAPQAVLLAALEPLRPLFAAKGITLGKEFVPGSDVEILADPQRLHQLFSNLLDNALKYTDAPGVLKLRMERSGSSLQIELCDSAPTVTAAEMERLFERLYRVESSRNRETGGAGLGLTICRNIAEAHQGTLIAHPSPLGGLCLTLTLPLTMEAT